MIYADLHGACAISNTRRNLFKLSRKSVNEP
jgi:hypothetical protein